MDNKNKEEKAKTFDAVNQRLKLFFENLTPQKISLTRTSAYAATGVCLAIILTLVQKDVLSTPQYIALLTSALAIPILIFYANLNENFLWIGERSYRHYREMHKTPVLWIIVSIGYGCFSVSFFSLIWHASIVASLISIAVSYVLLLTNDYILKRITAELDEEG